MNMSIFTHLWYMHIDTGIVFFLKVYVKGFYVDFYFDLWRMFAKVEYDLEMNWSAVEITIV